MFLIHVWCVETIVYKCMPDILVNTYDQRKEKGYFKNPISMYCTVEVNLNNIFQLI